MSMVIGGAGESGERVDGGDEEKGEEKKETEVVMKF